MAKNKKMDNKPKEKEAPLSNNPEVLRHRDRVSKLVVEFDQDINIRLNGKDYVGSRFEFNDAEEAANLKVRVRELLGRPALR